MSGPGGTPAKLAKALSEGAGGVAGVEVVMKKTGEVAPEDIKRASGILLGSPVHMHNLSVEAMQFLARLEAIATFLELRFVAVGGLESGDWGNLGAEATTMDPDLPGVSEKDLTNARRAGERFARLTKQFQVK